MAPVVVGGLGVMAPAFGSTTVATFHGLVVDDAHEHVFVSEGSRGVLVTDLATHALTILSGLGSADDLVLSGDDSTLYVADHADHSVIPIDTTTLDIAPALSTGDYCPTAIAEVGSFVWLASPCGQSRLVAIDPANGALTPSDADVDVSAPHLTSRDDHLVLADDHDDYHTVTSFQASSGTPTLTKLASTNLGNPSDIGQVAITPDGASVVAAQRGADSVLALDTLEPRSTTYRFGTSSIAFRGDGEAASGGQVFVYLPDQRSPWRDYDNVHAVAGGLAWGDQILYVVSPDGGLHIASIVPRQASSVTISTPPQPFRPTYGGQVRLTVTLDTESTNRQVTIYSAPSSGQRSAVAHGTVAQHDHAHFYVTASQSTTYEAVYNGDDSTDGSTDSAKVRVRSATAITFKHPASQTTVSDGSQRLRQAYYRSGSTAHVVGTIHAVGSSCGVFTLRIRKQGRWHTIGKTSCIKAHHHHVGLSLRSQRGLGYYETLIELTTHAAHNDPGGSSAFLQFCEHGARCGEGG